MLLMAASSARTRALVSVTFGACFNTILAAPGGGTAYPSSRPTRAARESKTTETWILYVIIGCVVCGVISTTLAAFYCVRECSRAEAERQRSTNRAKEKDSADKDLEMYAYISENEDSEGPLSTGSVDLLHDLEIDGEVDNCDSQITVITRKNVEAHNRALQAQQQEQQQQQKQQQLQPSNTPPLMPRPEDCVWRPVYSQMYKKMAWQNTLTNSVVYRKPTVGTILQSGSNSPSLSPDLKQTPPQRRKSLR